MAASPETSVKTNCTQGRRNQEWLLKKKKRRHSPVYPLKIHTLGNCMAVILTRYQTLSNQTYITIFTFKYGGLKA